MITSMLMILKNPQSLNSYLMNACPPTFKLPIVMSSLRSKLMNPLPTVQGQTTISNLKVRTPWPEAPSTACQLNN